MPRSWLRPSGLSRRTSPCPGSPLSPQAWRGRDLPGSRGAGRGRGSGCRVPHAGTCWPRAAGESGTALAWARRGHGGSGGRGCAHTQTKGWPCPAAGSVPAASASPAPPVQVPGLARDRGASTGGEHPPRALPLPNPPTVTHGCGRADGTWAGAGPQGGRAHPSRAGAGAGAVLGHRFLGGLPARCSPSPQHRSAPSVAAIFVSRAGAGLASPCSGEPALARCRWHAGAARSCQLWVSPHSAAHGSQARRPPALGGWHGLAPGRLHPWRRGSEAGSAPVPGTGLAARGGLTGAPGLPKAEEMPRRERSGWPVRGRGRGQTASPRPGASVTA